MTIPAAKIAMLLITLGLGYIVCYFAAKATRGLKLLGIGIGTFIIAMSLFFIIANIITGIRYPSYDRSKPIYRRCVPGPHVIPTPPIK